MLHVPGAGALVLGACTEHRHVFVAAAAAGSLLAACWQPAGSLLAAWCCCWAGLLMPTLTTNKATYQLTYHADFVLDL
jgi:hypothetical protein